jgi:hypothetical protein
MGLIDLVFQRQEVEFEGPNILDFVTLDASISERYSSTAEVTDHPVEEGVDISDHVRRRPREIVIEGMVSNTPDVILASTRFDLGPPGVRAEAAYFDLLRLQTKGARLTVTTSLREFKNMVITGLDLSRDADTANVARMTISLREVFTLEGLSEQIELPLTEITKRQAKLGKRGLAVGALTAGLVALSAGATAAFRAIRAARQ